MSETLKETFTLPLSASQIIDEYKNLHLGGKNVVCPYFINKKKERAGLRALIGKGDPSEIEKEVKVWAKLKDFDLVKADASQIREFMQNCNIGVDCSGFIVHIFNFWLKTEGKKPLQNQLKFKKNGPVTSLKRFIRPVENISANTITSVDNTIKITNIDEIKPGDLIRSKGKVRNSHHLMLVTKVVKENGKVTQFEYVHSTSHFAAGNGVRTGKIVITDTKKPLSAQNWIESDRKPNSTLIGFMNNEDDNGIRRLKFL